MNKDFQELVNYYVEQGEMEFAELVNGYPYIVLVALTVCEDERDITFIHEIEVIEKWLEEHMTEAAYVSFPNNAVGQYKAMWQYVYFKSSGDATRFKLIWG